MRAVSLKDISPRFVWTPPGTFGGHGVSISARIFRPLFFIAATGSVVHQEVDVIAWQQRIEAM